MPDIAEKYWTEADDRNTEQQPNGFPGGMPAYIDTTGRMVMGAVKRSWRRSNPHYETEGAADDYTVTPELSPTRLNRYEVLRLRIDRANTTATPTLKFGRADAATIVKVGPAGSQPLDIGDLVAGADQEFWFDGTDFICSNPAVSAAVDGAIAAALVNRLLAFPDRATAVSASILASIHGIQLNGDATEGDGAGGLFIDTNNGNPDTFTSNGGTRTWYRAADVGLERLTNANLIALGTSQADALNYLDAPLYVGDRTTLKAVDTTKITVIYLKEAGRVGYFKWTPGDFSAQITADTLEGVYLKADAIASTSGAWVREFDGTVRPSWYGAAGDGVADDTAELSAAIASGFNVNLSWGIYRITSKITSAISNQDIYADGYPRVGTDIQRSATILIDNASLDYAFHFTNTNVVISGIKFTSDSATTAEPILFKRPDGSAADVDCRVLNCAVEGGVALGFTVVGRGLHVKNCEFGNLTRGIALDVPTDWVPNGQTNDLQETAWRSYIIEDNLFHGTVTWVTNTGANKQYVRAIVMAGNLGDIGGCPFEGCLVDSTYDANNSNIGTTSATVLKLHAGSRNSTIIGARVGGILEGTANRMPNNCVQLATSTANPSRDLVFMGSFGPCLRDGIQIFGEGPLYGVKFMGCSIDRPAQTLGGGYAPISVFNNGGTLTQVEIAIVGLSLDLTGTDSTTIIGGTNSAVIEIAWIAPQIRGRNIPVAQSLVRVFQSIAETNPEYALYSRKNGTWATDGSEWFARLIALTADISGGGVGISGSFTLLPSTSTGAGSFWRAAVSSSSVRNQDVLDITAGGIVPVTDVTFTVGTAALRWLAGYFRDIFFGDGTRSITSGAGSPEGVITAPIGSLYTNTAGGASTTLYVKTSGAGNTGWTAK